MAAQSAKQRWSAHVPDELSDPKGPEESLKRAFERLGPFKHRTHQEAKEAGQYDGLDGRISLSAELALGRTWKLAKSYNEQVRLEKGAPRTKDVAENLLKLHLLSSAMSDLLKGFDDMTRHRLHTFGSGIQGARDFLSHPKGELADAEGLPKIGETGRWVERLTALSDYAAACFGVFLQSKGIGFDGTIDKGGNRNLHKDLWGAPSYRLVTDGGCLYDLFKPDEATGTEGGPFHLFLMDVFEFATGQEPEEHSRLVYWLKKLVPVHRRHKEVMAAQRELNEELHEMYRANPPIDLKVRERRGAEVCALLRSLEQERGELFAKMHPYSFGAFGR